MRIGATTAARMTFEPGWRGSKCVKPVAGTENCQARHVGVVHSGRLAVMHEDGTEVEIGPGEAYVIEPGHDAWVVGDERFVGLEFESRSRSHTRSAKRAFRCPSAVAKDEWSGELGGRRCALFRRQRNFGRRARNVSPLP